MKINLTHGSGGQATGELIEAVFAKAFGNEILNRMEDSAVVDGSVKIAVTTDSFVVTPVFYSGGDIGRLAVCGTVNDLLMSGAVPKYLTCGFIIEEGAETDDLHKIAASMQAAANEAGVRIVAGDTKVIQGSGGIYINTSGVGFVPEGRRVCPQNCKEDDVIILSGNLGDHHAAILSARMNIKNTIKSDCAPLNQMVEALFENSIDVKAMRDVTRGGLGTIINEFANAAGLTAVLNEESLPVDEQVKSLCGILGLDPLYMGNEGKFVAVVPKQQAEQAVNIMRGCKYGENACIVGNFEKGEPKVVLNTKLGGKRRVGVLIGEGLPRIC
ncbi:MAG TPA: hydrogenase expression/formation protein HypE [Ruminococcaceae bacterium]|nr:hydrogenase expression/formation protein HypE [Oscillospiraceae bacterium]